jgi:predicted phosphodiesterase
MIRPFLAGAPAGNRPTTRRGSFVQPAPGSSIIRFLHIGSVTSNMRYLILSDIHANVTALDAALAAAKGKWEKAVCLGDVVGYGPDPNEVIDRVRSLPAIAIRGNHDKAGSGLADAEDFNPVARAVALWTRAQLTPDNKDWLEKLPVGPVTLDGFSIVHGAARDEDEYVFAPAQALDSLLEAPSPVTFFGHTHLQGGFTLHDDVVGALHFKPAGDNPFSTLNIESGTTYLLNPGSIGQPRDGDTRAAFAIADLANHSVEFWRVPYDIEAVQKRMGAGGLPEPLIQRLSFGR